MWRHVVFFALLYFVQGGALAYVINFQKPYLLSQGISKPTIGLFTSLLLIPFIGKVLLGAISDRFPWGRWGSRKPYMVIGLALFSFSYFAIASIPPSSRFALFASLTWLASLGLALFDTCADGWAVDTAAPHEQSAIQAAMIAGKSLGLLSMAFLFGRWASQEGYALVFHFLALMSAGVLLAVLLVPYQRRVARVESLGLSWNDLYKGFYLAFAALGVVYSMASFGVDGLLSLYLADVRRLSAENIGVFGVARGFGALVGAALYVPASRRLGSLKTQYLALALMTAGCLFPLLPVDFMVLGVMWGSAWGFQETAYVTLAMRFAKGPWSATFFALAMIFSNLGTSLGEAFGAPMVSSIGYRGVFLSFAAMAALSPLLVPKAFSRFRDH
jgi:PAT family beta-lactamase induction signal transducer AmpG